MSESRQLCIPYVAAIIERQAADGELELLVQTRFHKYGNLYYNGTLEFAAGTMDKLYEDVFTAVKREVREETGLEVTRFIDESRTEPVTTKGEDLIFGFRPFCCTQQLREGKPWVGFVFRCEVSDGEPQAQDGETKDVHWMRARDFYHIYKNHPEQIFGLEYPAWQYFFKSIGYEA